MLPLRIALVLFFVIGVFQGYQGYRGWKALSVVGVLIIVLVIYFYMQFRRAVPSSQRVAMHSSAIFL